MRTLSEKACSEWLDERSIARGSGAYYNQFRLPPEAPRCASVLRGIVASAEPFEVALLQYMDWAHYKSDEMEVISTLRFAHGEQRPLIESPGHLFEASERDLLIGMFSLAVLYRWSAYLYFDHHTKCLCWEGELLDFWAPERERLSSAEEVFQQHSLHSTRG